MKFYVFSLLMWWLSLPALAQHVKPPIYPEIPRSSSTAENLEAATIEENRTKSFCHTCSDLYLESDTNYKPSQDSQTKEAQSEGTQ